MPHLAGSKYEKSAKLMMGCMGVLIESVHLPLIYGFHATQLHRQDATCHSPQGLCLLTGGADRAKPTNKRSFFLSFLFFQQNVGFQCIYLPTPLFANLSPRIDSKEPIPQCCVAWRAGTATLFNRFLAPKYCLKIPALCITVYIFSSFGIPNQRRLY
jgi:hypothetical protein